MPDPKVIVVGTGRCATKSIADMIGAPHEYPMVPTVYAAAARSHGWLSDHDIHTIYEHEVEEWPEAIVDYKQSELIDVTSKMFPETFYLWIVRNPKDTIASMVKKGWYKPEEDNYPPGFQFIYGKFGHEGRVTRYTLTNYVGNRTRADIVGERTPEEWRLMGQIERCAWWWDYCNRAIHAQVSRLDDDRWEMVRLEDTGSWFARKFGKEEFPHVNRSGGTELEDGWQDIVRQTATNLGYM